MFWFGCRYLDIPERHIKNIQKDAKFCSVTDNCLKVFRKWLDGVTEATLSKLISALKELDQGHALTMLRLACDRDEYWHKDCMTYSTLL